MRARIEVTLIRFLCFTGMLRNYLNNCAFQHLKKEPESRRAVANLPTCSDKRKTRQRENKQSSELPQTKETTTINELNSQQRHVRLKYDELQSHYAN